MHGYLLLLQLKTLQVVTGLGHLLLVLLRELGGHVQRLGLLLLAEVLARGRLLLQLAAEHAVLVLAGTYLSFGGGSLTRGPHIATILVKA